MHFSPFILFRDLVNSFLRRHVYDISNLIDSIKLFVTLIEIILLFGKNYKRNILESIKSFYWLKNSFHTYFENIFSY